MLSQNYFRFLSLFLASLGVVQSANAYNIDDAVSAATKSNNGLHSAEANLKSAKIAKAGAYTGFLPTVANQTSIVRSSPDKLGTGNSDKQNYRQNTLQISQPLFSGWGTVSQVKKSQADFLASKATYDGTYNSVVYSTIQAYENVLTTRDLLALSESNLKTIAEQRRLAVARFELGESTRTDIAQADARYASALSTHATRSADVTAAEANFMSIVGQEAPQNMLPINITPLKLPAPDANAALQQALIQMPQLQTYKHQVTSAQENVNISISQALPTVKANAQFNKYREVNTGNNPALKNSFYDSNQYTLQMDIPIFNPAIYANIGQYKQAASKAKSDYDNASNDLAVKIYTAWAQYYAQQEVVKSALATIETAKIALEGVVEEFKLGTRAFLDILNAEQELFNAKIQHRQAESSYKVAAFNLHTLAGSIGKIDFKDFIYKTTAVPTEPIAEDKAKRQAAAQKKEGKKTAVVNQETDIKTKPDAKDMAADKGITEADKAIAKVASAKNDT